MVENVLWQMLEEADPEEVCRRSGAVFNPELSVYSLPIFSEEVTVLKNDRTITAQSPLGTLLLSDYREHFILSTVAYLVYADGKLVTGKLVNPKSMSGGDIYRKGAHVLPLDRLAAQFANDAEGFLRTAQSLGGQPLEYGDASCRLFPFPHLPVSIALWIKDDEFAERADLFFDSSSCGLHPPDVLWGVATICVELMCKTG